MGLPPGPGGPSPLQLRRWLRGNVDYVEQNRARFGDTFTLRFPTIGPLVFTGEPAVVKAVFAQDRDNTLPAGRSIALEPVLGPRSLLLLQGEAHMRRRKLMLPPFHGERMRAYEETITRATRAEVATWRAGEELPMRERMQAITLEVILEAVFGVGAGERHERLAASLRDVLSFTRSTGAQAFAAIGARLGVPGIRRFGALGRLSKSLAKTDAMLAEVIAERRADPALESREDILSMLISARFEDGERIDDAELRDQLMTLLVAGHETTATSLAWAFDLLTHHEEAYERARQAALDGDDAYLDAVAIEAMRVRPVIANVGRVIARPIPFEGGELPAGTSLMPSIYMVHTRPDLYPEPYAFRPERFLDSRPETYSWLPFGGGIRRCIGAAFASLEMRVVLREVLRSVTLHAASPRPERVSLASIVLVPRNGARVRVAPAPSAVPSI